ncbi:hypothetical protein D3C71_1928250 [compost metagenome]
MHREPGRTDVVVLDMAADRVGIEREFIRMAGQLHQGKRQHKIHLIFILYYVIARLFLQQENFNPIL